MENVEIIIYIDIDLYIMYGRKINFFISQFLKICIARRGQCIYEW